MKRLTLVALMIFTFLFVSLPVLSQTHAKKTIAILYFDNNSIADRDKLEPLKKGLADMFITEFSKIGAFEVVERERLEQITSELALQQTGVMDASTVQELGKLLGARYLVFGGFVNMFGGKMRIDLRIVEVESGLTIRAEEETAEQDEMFEMVKDLTRKVSDYFKVELSKADKKRLKSDTGSDDFDANVLYARGLELEDVARIHLQNGDKTAAKKSLREALQMYRDSLSKSSGFKMAEEKIAQISNRLKQL